jgi:60 kDa SS-A/Ro ribonucleoprotein
MSQYAQLFNPGQTPQSEPIPGKAMVQNNAGGFGFGVDKWMQLRRFCILGSSAPTYYQTARKLTKQNGEAVLACWKEDPARTVQIIEDISVKGLAPKNDPAIFALALGSTLPDPHVEGRQCAFAAMPAVCRTATDMFSWREYRKQLGGGDGRGSKRAIRSWYAGKLARGVDGLAYQAIKYRQRNGWTHKDALAVANIGSGAHPEATALLQWIKGKEPSGPLPALVAAHIEAMAVQEGEVKKLIPLIEDYKLPWEALPTWALTKPSIWRAMAPHMGLTAMIRKLGVMTSCGAISVQDWAHVTKRLSDEGDLRKSRIHPFGVLQALAVYKTGRGAKSKGVWQPVTQVIDALDAAFYASFGNVPSTGKRLMLCLDVSGSMSTLFGGTPLTCAQVSACQAMVTMAAEPASIVMGFDRGLRQIDISPRQRLDDVAGRLAYNGGGTDCSLPFTYAAHMDWKIDGFSVYTDNETWAGRVHPVQALQQYRNKSGINARSVVVGITSDGFSIADPADGGMLDIVGFDSSGPKIISEFFSGEGV